MEPTSWKCPFCEHDVIKSDDNVSENHHFFGSRDKSVVKGLITSTVICPNPNCKQITIDAALYDAKYSSNIGKYFFSSEDIDPITTWRLQPISSARTLPEYIPKPLREDYEEACSILNFSPKSSATLARRCIQGMIRDFWDIKEDNLAKEIKGIYDKVDSSTWKAIDAVRSVGNIGAHMEKDINVIIDVEPEEAQLLIKLIEDLFRDWYINDHERKQRTESIVQLAEEKKQEKQASSTSKS